MGGFLAEAPWPARRLALSRAWGLIPAQVDALPSAAIPGMATGLAASLHCPCCRPADDCECCADCDCHDGGCDDCDEAS